MQLTAIKATSVTAKRNSNTNIIISKSIQDQKGNCCLTSANASPFAAVRVYKHLMSLCLVDLTSANFTTNVLTELFGLTSGKK